MIHCHYCGKEIIEAVLWIWVHVATDDDACFFRSRRMVDYSAMPCERPECEVR